MDYFTSPPPSSAQGSCVVANCPSFLPRPWLPSGDVGVRNVAVQRDDRGSLLWLCRDLLALRRAELGGQIADYELLTVTASLWVYRTNGLTVLANLNDRATTWPGECGEILLSTGGQPERGAGGVVLGPWQGVIAR